MKNKIKILAIIGKAGSGKNTILSEFIKINAHNNPEKYFDTFHIVTPFTTRPPRPTEREGVEYFFRTDRDIKKLMNEDKVLQITEFRNWKYGFLNDDFQTNKINVGIFNPTAVNQILTHSFVDMTVAYVTAPDKDRLLRQLTREEFPDIQEILRRYKADNFDFSAQILQDIPKLIQIPNPNSEKAKLQAIATFVDLANSMVKSN